MGDGADHLLAAAYDAAAAVNMAVVAAGSAVATATDDLCRYACHSLYYDYLCHYDDLSNPLVDLADCF